MRTEMNLNDVEINLGRASGALASQTQVVSAAMDRLMAELAELQVAQRTLALAKQAASEPNAQLAAADDAFVQVRQGVKDSLAACQQQIAPLQKLCQRTLPAALTQIRQDLSFPASAHDEWSTYTLSLHDVACWQFKNLAQHGRMPPIVALLPSLQRGAVWKPNQIEMLWDSLLRGFPVGSLVVCRKLKRQESRSGAHADADNADKWDARDVTHHLLDGQQRCNAIALAFNDPFPLVDDNAADPHTILWVDLDPAGPASSAGQIPHSSTRSYLPRVTTLAHPWGFGVADGRDTQRLETQVVRAALNQENGVFQWQGQGRPHPRDAWPLKANVPVPMAWLLEACKAKPADAATLWDTLRDRCAALRFGGKQPGWAATAQKLLDESSRERLAPLASALFRLESMVVVALPVPVEALTAPSRFEQQAASEGTERIANVEHLFQRLNAGGTELRGDDLAYSMIKAYWPGIEQTIADISKIGGNQKATPRPPETQTAILGARLALSLLADKPTEVSVASLRLLAVVTPQSQATAKSSPKDQPTKLDQLKGLKAMFDLDLAPGVPPTRMIGQIFEKMEEWWVYEPTQRPWGLPRVLRSRMAVNAPDVFLFLMKLAYAGVRNPTPAPAPNVLQQLLGLATAMHWFGDEVSAAVKYLWGLDSTGLQWLDGTVFKNHPTLLKDLRDTKKLFPANNGNAKVGIAKILAPNELAAYVTLPNTTSLAQWRWHQALVVAPAIALEPVVGMLSAGSYSGKNALLLYYAQRETMETDFPDYDPSRADFWELHNVPWDFDHILPGANFYNLKVGRAYAGVCAQWGNTIANLHLLPFEHNRSRQDQLAKISLPSDLPALKRMVLWDAKHPQAEDRRGAFSITQNQVRGTEAGSDAAVLQFVTDARARLLRIYSDWYDNLHIGSML